MRISMSHNLSAKTGVVALAMVLALVGCEEPSVTVDTPTTPDMAGGSAVNRDVERPDVFGVTENALWDGRPSLGGVWVAYPANIDPERVIIRNIANGKSVIGALFRRERDNPGPKIQLSSDAATALGVIAGSPSEISVVALRRETVEVEVEVPEPEVAAEENEAAPEAIEVVETPVASAVVVAPVAAATGAGIAAIVEETLAEVPVSEAPEETAPAPSIFALQKPYIQVSTFAEEAHAVDLATMLNGEGLEAAVQADNPENPTLWRVVTGPYDKRSSRNAQLRIIRGLGFTDAFTFK